MRRRLGLASLLVVACAGAGPARPALMAPSAGSKAPSGPGRAPARAPRLGAAASAGLTEPTTPPPGTERPAADATATAAATATPGSAVGFAPRVSPDAEFRDWPPEPGTRPPFRAPPVRRFRLPSGLEVILAESHRLPIVSLELVFRIGGAASLREPAGLAPLYARLLPGGTAKHSGAELSEELASIGATLGAQADAETLSVSIATLSEHFDRATALWAEVVQSPRLDGEALGRGRASALERLARRRADPAQVADLVLARLLFGDTHVLGRTALGTEQSLGRLTPPDLQRFQQSTVRPANAVLIAAGDITEFALRTTVARLFAAWRTPPAAAPAPARAPTPPERTTIALVDGAEDSASLRIGFVGLARRSPDYAAAVVANHLLGGGGKRLDRLLREQRGWASSVRSTLDARRGVGPWLARAEVETPNAAAALSELLKTIRALRDGEPTLKELDEVKQELLDSLPARFATPHQAAAQVAALAVQGLPATELATWPRRIAAVTPADVRRVAQKYLQPDHAVIVVVGDRKQLEPALRKLGEVELRDAEGALKTPPDAERPALTGAPGD